MITEQHVFPETHISEISLINSRKDLCLFYTPHYNCLCWQGEKNKSRSQKLKLKWGKEKNRTRLRSSKVKCKANTVLHVQLVQVMKLTLFDFIKIFWFKIIAKFVSIDLFLGQSWGAMSSLKVSFQGCWRVLDISKIQFRSLGLQMLKALHVSQQREAGVIANESYWHSFLIAIHFLAIFFILF